MVEVDEEYDANDTDGPPDEGTVAMIVTPLCSLVISAGYKQFTSQILLDSGAESSLIHVSEIKHMGIKISPNNTQHPTRPMAHQDFLCVAKSMKNDPRTPNIRWLYAIHWLYASCLCLSLVDIHSSWLMDITLCPKHHKITFEDGSTYCYTDAR